METGPRHGQGGGFAPVGWSRLPPVGRGKRTPVEEDAASAASEPPRSPAQYRNIDQHIDYMCIVRDSIFYDGMRAFMCMHVCVYIYYVCVCAHTHPALIYIAIEILNCRLRMRDHIDSCSEPARRDGEYGLTASCLVLIGCWGLYCHI